MAEAATIYVIDDDTALRTAYAAALSRLGYKVEVAQNGQEGQQLLGKSKPALIILDMLMPIQDGISFLKQLRSDPKNKSIKVVVVSNFEPMAELKDLDATYMSKLLNDPEALADKVDKLIKVG